MKFTLELITEIEKSLGIKLYKTQIEDLINNDAIYNGRRNGKTTVYIIKLALSKGEPLEIHEFRYWTDRRSDETNYTSWFQTQFMRIREALRDSGFIVRDITLNDKLI